MNAIPQRMIQTKVQVQHSEIAYENTAHKSPPAVFSIFNNHMHSAVHYTCNRSGLLCAFFSQIAAVSAFAQTLRRYTSLNHLAQAARAVLQNTSQINQMLSDLNRVDFANVQVRTDVCVWPL